MNFVLLTILFFSSVATVLGSTNSQDNKNININCDEENLSKANVCAEKLWFVGKRSRKYPENESQMQKHCKQTPNLIRCVKDFTDQCGKDIQKQLANVMLYTMKTIDKSYCSKSVKRRELMSMSCCGNAIREQSNECMEKFMTDLGKANKCESKMKVPHACCAFRGLKECILRSARSVGTSVCDDKPIENLEKYMDSLSVNTLNLMCGDYEEDSDKCKHLSPFPKDVKYSKPSSVIVGFGQLLE